MEQNQKNPQPEAAQDAPEEVLQGAPESAAEGNQNAEVDVIDFKDKYIRAMAEMENLRKRLARDVEDARRFAVTGFAREMLDVSDNLDRALAATPDADTATDQIKSLQEGVSMVQQHLQRVLTQFKIEKTHPQPGDRFDPERHQAMFEVPTDKHPAGVVVEVMQPGYVIAGRLLRPALVGTAKPLVKEEPQKQATATSKE